MADPAAVDPQLHKNLNADSRVVYGNWPSTISHNPALVEILDHSHQRVQRRYAVPLRSGGLSYTERKKPLH